ncbi:MAG: hypothetical protein ACLUHM_09825, partial [Bifidobacterium adolescentis]
LRDRVHPVRLDCVRHLLQRTRFEEAVAGRLALRVACVAGGLCCGALAFVLVIAFISAFAIAFAFPDYSMGHGFLLNNQTSCQ